jgi:L-threonylcarbamoyladenylate synthase
VRLLDAAALQAGLRVLQDQAGPARVVVGVYSRFVPKAGAGWTHRVMPADASAAAHELFAVLREFDAAGLSAIWVEQPPPGPEWDGVRDRLSRAAAA